ncbi:hypothetical protein K3495_g3817 [Podosphaera aphanis]|nr:hypothetical protein K3495_g3817 [Podosphaera aphanis]
MFQNIASVLDDALDEYSSLPQHLQKSFRNFIVDLSSVARRNFECHVRGSQRPPIPYSATSNVQASFVYPVEQKCANDSHPKHPKAYATVAMAPATKQHSQAPPRPVEAQAHTRHKAQAKSKPEDNRLLVRVGQGHLAPSSSPYAIMLKLNTFLQKKLVREIQTIKPGFAICPVSAEAQEKLTTRMGEIESSLSCQGQCKVEKPGQHAAYRFSGVPRSYTVFNGSTVERKEITASIVADVLTYLTNIPPHKCPRVPRLR